MAWSGCLHQDKHLGNCQYSCHHSSSCCVRTSGRRVCFQNHLSAWLGRDTLHWVPRSTEQPGEERWLPSCFQCVEWEEIFSSDLYTWSFSIWMTSVRNFRFSNRLCEGHLQHLHKVLSLQFCENAILTKTNTWEHYFITFTEKQFGYCGCSVLAWF